MTTNTAAFDFCRATTQTPPDSGRHGAEGQAVTAANYPDGVLWLNGHMMHVCAFEVEEVGGVIRAINPEFTRDLDSIIQLIDACPVPVTLPGLSGLWVLYCMPKGK